MRGLLVSALCGSLVAGCASSASDIKASYVSPMTYQTYDCGQLSAEAQRVSAAAAQASGEQDSKRTSDTIATTAAAVGGLLALSVLPTATNRPSKCTV